MSEPKLVTEAGVTETSTAGTSMAGTSTAGTAQRAAANSAPVSAAAAPPPLTDAPLTLRPAPMPAPLTDAPLTLRPAPMPAPPARLPAPTTLRSAPDPGKQTIPGAQPAAPQPPKPQTPDMFAPLSAPGQGLSVEDLPFASEVDAAWAARPRRSARLLSLSVAAMFAVLLGWAAVAEIDEVTHAEGQVIASQRTQSIQNLEGGILRAVLVREGQIVEKDTPLARLDNEMAESYVRDTVNKALEARAAIIRLNAELAGTPPVYAEHMEALLEGLRGKGTDANLQEQARRIIADQTAMYANRHQQREAELRVLESQYVQRQREVEEQLARKSQLDRSLALAMEQRNLAYPLMQRQIYSRTDFLGLEQKVVQLRGDVASLAASIPKTQAAAEEAKQRIELRRAEMDTAITEEANKQRTELSSLLETLNAGKDRVTRTELRSPVRGTVKQIYLNTVGGVVKPGESIMEVVPLDDTLLIEARVRPADVAFLHPGQPAMTKVSAYDFSIYGGLEGKLEQISADTIEDKRGDFYYLVKVRTQKTAIAYRGEELPIIPGMMVTVDILTGKKTVLDYLMKPILKAGQNALRER